MDLNADRLDYGVRKNRGKIEAGRDRDRKKLCEIILLQFGCIMASFLQFHSVIFFTCHTKEDEQMLFTRILQQEETLLGGNRGVQFFMLCSEIQRENGLLNPVSTGLFWLV